MPELTAVPPLMNITPDLCTALASLQGELPEIERDRTVNVNEDHPDPKKRYSYSYATLAHITERIMPKLSAHGLSYSAYPGIGQDGRMCLRYFLLHSSGGYIGGEFPLPGEGGIQGLGGRITYAKRYCLLAVTGLAAEEDDESHLSAEDDGGPRAVARKPRAAAAASRAEQAAANTARRNQRAAEERTTAPAGDGPPREVRTPGDPVTGPQQQKLVLQFKDLGVDDREQRLAIVSQLVGFQVTTIKDLTKGQAHELIEIIDSALHTPDPMVTLRQVSEDVAAKSTTPPAPDQEGTPPS